jgi:hypothetical protein
MHHWGPAMPVSVEVATLFLDELAKRNIEVKLDDEGTYILDVCGLSIKVSLENVSRDFERDRDPDRIVTFVDSITNHLVLPEWQEAKGRIRWQPEPSDHEFGDSLRDAVSDKVSRVLVYVDPSETQIQWLTATDAKKWNKTRADLMSAAQENMDRILRQTKIETAPIEEHQLGILSNELVAFKAALLLCSNLKEAVEPVLGWPLFAVMLCRDFVYLLHQKDRSLIGRMGQVVMREYQKSGYPVSTEVFEITDQGIRAIADYQSALEQASMPVKDGMKTIRYRGGIVTFRIPAHWTEEYEEKGGGVFYDEVNYSGTLRLNVLTFATKTPVTTRTAMSLLEARRKDYQGTLTDLGDGNALLRYTEVAREEGESLAIHYWQIANVVPPNHFRVAIFSFTKPMELANDDVAADVAMMDEELRLCRFAEELGE